MNLNSHFLMRAVNLKQPARLTAAALPASAAGSAAMQLGKPTGAAEAAASFNANTNSSSGSLAEAVGYAAAAAASGSIRVVLSVPDEAPPTDRNGKEWWPPGWQPADAAANQSSSAAAAAAAAAGADGGSDISGAAADGGMEAGKQRIVSSKDDWGTNSRYDRARLAALVESGAGSSRGIVCEQDLFELLGVPFLLPNQRNC
jgi:hypothetical protein